MRTINRLLGLAFFAAGLHAAGAATYYVTTNGVDGANDGQSWGAAWRTISNAVAKASDSDEIVVSNGTYVLSTNILVMKALTITGTNGAAVTTLDGGNNVRCLVISNSAAVVQGFTITRGKAATTDYHATRKLGGGAMMFKGTLQDCLVRLNAAQDGCGVYFMSNAVVRRCRIEYNTGNGYGGGIGNHFHAGGLVDSCAIIGNTCAVSGGADLMAGSLIVNSVVASNSPCGLLLAGASTGRCCLVFANFNNGVQLTGGTLENCTVAGNSTYSLVQGGGLDATAGSTIKNCIIRGNRGYLGDYTIAASTSATYSCLSPAFPGAGNTAADPLFLNPALNDFRPSLASPCFNKGTNLAWMAGATDLAGNPRISPSASGTNDMGCYEWPAEPLSCTFEAGSVNGLEPFQVIFTATASGTNLAGLTYRWSFTNGAVIDAQGADKRVVTNAYFSGTWPVTLSVSNAAGETATLTRPAFIKAGPAALYVAKGIGNTATFPYDTWSRAASNIQAAVNAGALGSTVWVSNDTYSVTQSITVLEGLSIQKFGSGVTAVNGSNLAGCFILDHTNAVLDGFTITNGNSAGITGYGGGVRLRAGTVQNCAILRNTANRGGGVALYYGAVLRNCSVVSNIGVNYACGIGSRDDGTWGGGTAGNLMPGGYVENCSVVGNSGGYGGAVELLKCTLRNCLIAGNAVPNATVGGVYAADCTLENCTIALNNMANAGATSAGGLYGDANTRLYNTIVWGNTSTSPNKDYYFAASVATAVCCRLQPVYVKGVNGMTNDPLLVNASGGDYTLSSASPCINAGSNLAWMTGTTTNDLAGNSRIQGGRPDMGPYEFNLDKLSVMFQPDAVQGFDPFAATFTTTLSGLNTNNVYYRWSFTNGAAVSLEGYALRVVTNTYPAGSYVASLTVSNAQGETATYTYPAAFKAGPPVAYVANAGWNSSVYPYANWATAASNIQLAVNAGVPGTLAWVTDGVYAVSVAITNPWGVTIRSVNGRAATTIRGGGVSNCYSSAHTASTLDGFTIRNGGGNVFGGGAYLQAGSLLNCLVISNQAARGGGVYLNSTDTLVSNCTVCGNSTAGSYGGGIAAVDYAGGLVVDCIVTNNTSGFCGGLYMTPGGRIRNCLVAWNSCGSSIYALGGGVTIGGAGSWVENCTIVSNVIASANVSAGGIYMDANVDMVNTLVYGNSNSVNTNYSGGRAAYYCDVWPAWTNTGTGNISADPQFASPAARDYRLQSGSPCVNAGTNLPWMAGARDVAGQPRLVKGRVDMGAYERQPEPGTLIVVN